MECLILLEDLDLALPDLIACILTIMEKQEHTLQLGEKIIVNSECRILVTINSLSKRCENLNLLNDYPLKIDFDPLTLKDLNDICDIQFPRLNSIKEKILNIFCDVQEKISTICPLDRQLSVR